MQCLASLQTAPACGFGSSIREAGSKVKLLVSVSLNLASPARSLENAIRLLAPSFILQSCYNAILCAQTYISPEADRALCKSQGGNNSQGPIYKVPVRFKPPIDVIPGDIR